MIRRFTLTMGVCTAWLSVFVLPGLAAPVAQESSTSPGSGGYPIEWPAGPPKNSVPDWAAPGLIRFSRWDGGPIETAKAFLSGWPGMNPPIPDYVYVTTNWYDPATVKFLRDAHINLIWVTFSNGFSIQSEQVQRDLLKPYIAECQKYGIHVMAYESVANLFWEDMFQNEPESKDWILLSGGKPVPYGAGDYTKMGRVTRYMADLSKPEWKAYLKRRIDLAIEAGADGVMYDNCLAGSTIAMQDALQELMQYSLSRKKDFLLMANFHRDKYILNRVLNCITTEDGGESGVFSEKAAGRFGGTMKIDGGVLVNHVGLLRTFENLSEGWKPVMVESNIREQGVRETDYMRPKRQQLAIAEPRMFGVSSELFVELRFAHDLYRADPAATAAWQAIGQYNAFFEKNAEYYRSARSVAPLAVVLDNRSEGQDTMNSLAARNVQYNVLYKHELTPELVKGYSAVFLLSAETMRDSAISTLENYVKDGGTLFAVGAAATKDETGKTRTRPTWFGQKLGRGESFYWEKSLSDDELAKTLLLDVQKPFVQIEAPKGVLYNVSEQATAGRRMIHLLNYLPNPVEKTIVRITGKHEHIQLLTPDENDESLRIIRATDETTEIEIPQIKIYSVLVLYPKR